MPKLYPIVKMAKTSLGRKLAPEDRYVRLYYCPMCNKRMSQKDVDPGFWDATRRCKNGEPVHCKHCGTLIHPLNN